MSENNPYRDGYFALWLMAAISLCIIAFVYWTMMYSKGYQAADKDHQAAYKANYTAEQNYDKCVVEPTVQEALECYKDAEKADRGDQRAEQDLDAQREMANWAEGMLWATLFVGSTTIIITGLGVYLVKRTLEATEIATGAALKAVEATEKTGRDQSRAYVNADAAELFWGSSSGTSWSVLLTIKNSGSTPAKWFRIHGDIVTEELQDDGLLKNFGHLSDFDLTANSPREWSGLAANSSLTAPVPISYDDPMGHWRRGADLVTNRKTIAIHAVGVIRYCTIYDEIYESEFWFNVRRPRAFSGNKVGATVDGGDLFKERPITLQRNSGSVETFKYMGQRKQN